VERAMMFRSWWRVAASFSDGRVEIVDGVEVFVNERLVDERP
jgi:hypothetical protein